mmetsp:Transcript_7428/g.9907  ORF Transcript_7428/g.9907 Transcript_7428/m.9907 type:complete len:323 (+) Transcript_7428:179-1147(+)|eukprot:CAMPEP_0117809224 /NCGR_PEP_ID=MMETSP0948-20121206/20572_1 /TAXON_ID=44440 /ORGANISM="Chattonella subsalsa, Strain CCMP2191" /LENGTH=322 /DNA_ID=CAMNT_0005644921 /DNA_START=178 /DNA_END=1146 /DNA_ORIENTATION=+
MVKKVVGTSQSQSVHRQYFAGLHVEDEHSLRRRLTQRIIHEVTLSAQDKLMVGAGAGIIGTIFAFPLDTVKTRLQSSGMGSLSTVLRDIVTKQGPFGFYRGLGTTLIGVVPEKALQLGSNEICRDALKKADGTIDFHNQLLAAAVGGFCQSLIATPVELIKIRMQNQALQPPSERMHPLEIIRSLGLRGMYNGFGACFMRDVHFALLCFPMFSTMKSMATDSKGQISNLWLITTGVLSGAIGSGLTTPFDVVKTRMQMAHCSKPHRNAVDIFLWILKKDGLGGLYKGLGQRMPMAGTKIGCVLFAFEKQKQYLMSLETEKRW